MPVETSAEKCFFTAQGQEQEPPAETAMAIPQSAKAGVSYEPLAPSEKIFRYDLEINDPVIITLPEDIAKQLNEAYHTWTDDMGEVHFIFFYNISYNIL